MSTVFLGAPLNFGNLVHFSNKLKAPPKGRTSAGQFSSPICYAWVKSVSKWVLGVTYDPCDEWSDSNALDQRRRRCPSDSQSQNPSYVSGCSLVPKLDSDAAKISERELQPMRTSHEPTTQLARVPNMGSAPCFVFSQHQISAVLDWEASEGSFGAPWQDSTACDTRSLTATDRIPQWYVNIFLQRKFFIVKMAIFFLLKQLLL